MGEQRKFQKKSLNNNDYKGIEQEAKVVKGVFGSLGALALVVLNKDNIKAIGTEVLDIAKKAIKR